MNNNHLKNLGFVVNPKDSHPVNIIPKVQVVKHDKLFDIVFARSKETGLPRNSLKYVLSNSFPIELKTRVNELLMQEFPQIAGTDDSTAFDTLYHYSDHSLAGRERFLERLDLIVETARNDLKSKEG